MPEPDRRPPFPVRWIVAFGRFWVDFLVGDTPELFVGAVVAIAAAAGLAAAGQHTAAAAVLPVLVVAVLAMSLLRARRRA
jgi:hypothetical protein